MNPTLFALSEMLKSLGAYIDVFIPGLNRNSPSVNGLSLQPFPYELKIWHYGLKRSWRNMTCFLKNQAWSAHSLLRAKKYDLFFGVDVEGIIACRGWAKKKNIPFVYISFEIFFKDELKRPSEYREKKDEIEASRQADLVIIQDPLRGGLLADENSLSKEDFMYLPVSPSSSIEMLNSDYIRRRFNIPSQKTIVLLSGSLDDWTYADELLNNVYSWPENYVLCLHNPIKAEDSPYIRKILQSGSSNVFLSTTPLLLREYEELVASSDIGLVLYKPTPPSRYTQKNIENIGLSSGKFSFYMKYGVPVISVNQASYGRLLEDYVFGLNISSFEQMPEALVQIRSHHAHFSGEAKRLFQERLDFNLHWPKLLDRLCTILEKAGT